MKPKEEREIKNGIDLELSHEGNSYFMALLDYVNKYDWIEHKTPSGKNGKPNLDDVADFLLEQIGTSEYIQETREEELRRERIKNDSYRKEFNILWERYIEVQTDLLTREENDSIPF
jgi:hypothetical protein